MPYANRIILMGNLTRDPQLRYLPSQTPVVDFGLAVSRKFKANSGEDREEVLFIDCSAFGRTAEIINQYCQKGKPIYIEGRLKYDTWEDKQGGGKRSKHAVVVENMQLLGGRDGGGGGGGGAPAQDYGTDESQGGRPPARPQQRGGPPARPAPQGGGDAPISDEPHFNDSDIPF